MKKLCVVQSVGVYLQESAKGLRDLGLTPQRDILSTEIIAQDLVPGRHEAMQQGKTFLPI